MSENTRVTVQFIGTIEYDAAPMDSQGTPGPTTVEGHTEAMAGDIESALSYELAFEAPEPTDYVQKIHNLTVTGVTPAEIEHLAKLEAIATRAARLVTEFEEATKGLNPDVVPDLYDYDEKSGEYESGAWALVQELAAHAKKEA